MPESIPARSLSIEEISEDDDIKSSAFDLRNRRFERIVPSLLTNKDFKRQWSGLGRDATIRRLIRYGCLYEMISKGCPLWMAAAAVGMSDSCANMALTSFRRTIDLARGFPTSIAKEYDIDPEKIISSLFK